VVGAIVAAARQAPAYLDAMAADGHHADLCRYCSLGYATSRYRDVQEPPWGGLPTPRLLCARLTCDCIHRVFSLWAETLGTELFEIDHPGAGDLPPALVGTRPASLERVSRTASARFCGLDAGAASSSGWKRSADDGSIAMRCASGSRE
jgi:hypothetical protein